MAILNKPDLELETNPLLSAIASIVTHKTRVANASDQMELYTMPSSSFVKPTASPEKKRPFGLRLCESPAQDVPRPDFDLGAFISCVHFLLSRLQPIKSFYVCQAIFPKDRTRAERRFRSAALCIRPRPGPFNRFLSGRPCRWSSRCTCRPLPRSPCAQHRGRQSRYPPRWHSCRSTARASCWSRSVSAWRPRTARSTS